MSTWVEAQAFPMNDATSIVKFIKELFSQFGTPKAIISDRDMQFYIVQFEKALKQYGVHIKLHPLPSVN